MRLYALDHEGIVDIILYASSVRYNLRLLTLDRELGEFVGKKRLGNTLAMLSEV